MTDYQELPLTLVGPPVCHSSSCASIPVDTSIPADTDSLLSSDLDQSVERILAKYANCKADSLETEATSVEKAAPECFSPSDSGHGPASDVTDDSIGLRVKQLLQRIDTASTHEDRVELAKNLQADIQKLSDGSSSSRSSLHASDLQPSIHTIELQPLGHRTDLSNKPLETSADSNNDPIITRVHELLNKGAETSVIAAEATRMYSMHSLVTDDVSIDTKSSSSLNYNGLQKDLDEIQTGLQALQTGDLQLPQDKPSECESNVSRATQDSIRQFNWDYSADLLSNEQATGRFASTNEFEKRNFLPVRDVVSPENIPYSSTLSQRVEQIMRRESPQRQAYR